ncbi:MAG: hypothetical protein R3279_06670 [Putridiphycobacter sp.]|nr:hypothetical protein [Putridiphycobacter sp.]
MPDTTDEAVLEEPTDNNNYEAPDLAIEQKANLQIFIDAVKSGDTTKIANYIAFPFEMKHPVPAIKNEDDFLKRFSEVFDDSLIKIISESSVDSNYSAVGWRGIMLDYGLLWFDETGILFASNYQTQSELDHQDKLIAHMKTKLHNSVKDFERPATLVETKKFRVRIDVLADQTYRYASWPITKTMDEAPDLVINNGQYMAEGTGGNHRYVFKNGKYTYTVWINVIGPDEVPPASLEIEKDGEQILDQDAMIIE